MLRIHFRFNIEVPWEHQCFGRLRSENGYERIDDFPIDGPGGERIETIEMVYYYPGPGPTIGGTGQEEYMVLCKVSYHPHPPHPDPVHLVAHSFVPQVLHKPWPQARYLET